VSLLASLIGIPLICELNRTPELTGESPADSSVEHQSPGNSTDNIILFEPDPIHSSSHSDVHLSLDAAEGFRVDKGKGRDLSDKILPSVPASPSLSQSSLYDVEDLPDPQNDKGDIPEDILSDEAYALQIQSEDLANALQIMEDAQFAKTLDQGIEDNHPSMKEVSYTNQVAIALRQAALSVASP
jgi:hypothetical protein